MAMEREKLSTWLAAQIEEKGWTIRELGRRAGVSHTAVARAVSGETTPNADTCISLARALGAEPEWILRLAGRLPPLPPEVANEQELINLYRRLDPARCKAALSMMRGLVQGMSGHYTFVPADENAMDAACFRAMERLADEGNLIEVARKIQDNTTLRQQLAIDRKLDRMDAEDEARRGTGPDESGGSKTS